MQEAPTICQTHDNASSRCNHKQALYSLHCAGGARAFLAWLLELIATGAALVASALFIAHYIGKGSPPAEPSSPVSSETPTHAEVMTWDFNLLFQWEVTCPQLATLAVHPLPVDT